MSRFGVVFGLAVVAGLWWSSAAFAQTPGQGPPMPLAVDLAKIPAGSSADYAMTMGQLPPMKMRIALVGKSATANTIETTMEGGMLSAAGKVVMQMVLAPGPEGLIKKSVMQLGSGDPMELPVAMTGEKPFTKPNNKGLVGSETVKVAAGSFKAKHYRDKTPQGDKVDYWVSETAPPIGLVKIEADQKSNPQVKGKVTLELTAMGKDVKPSITKPAKPFDQAALMQQMMSAAGAGPGAKPAPPPSSGGPGAKPASPPPSGPPAPAPKK
jgi:hypothetical protein